MRCESYLLRDLEPRLGADCNARLNAYCRGRGGLLADDGTRWAVLVLPGGSYRRIAPAESEPVALAFLAAGMQAFVLEYSVLPRRWPQQFLEAAAAMAFLRDRAGEYGFRPDRVAVCGFSAGGHLAGYLANLWGHPLLGETLGLAPRQARPDAAALCYPVIRMEACLTDLCGGEPAPQALRLDRSVTPDNPPAFLWATVTDRSVPVDETLSYALALKERQVPFELHLFGDGPHAMGLADRESARDEAHYNPHAAVWHPLCVDWLKGL